METNTGMKFVEFDKFCQKCMNKDKSSTAEPCNECLTVPAREGTRKPIKFEEDKNNA